MTQRKVRIALASACLLALTNTACSSDDDSGAATAAPTGTDAAVDVPPAAGLTISGNTFSAASVVANTEFTITNNDGVAHTVTDDAGSFSASVPASGTESLTIPAAGTYSIHCNIHASMQGTITVA